MRIEVDASDSDNMKTLKRMKNETGEFTYDEVVVWLQMLSKIGKCQGLANRAEDYATRLVVNDEKNQGWLWLRKPEEFWSFMKPTHKLVLERFRSGLGLTAASSTFRCWRHQLEGFLPVRHRIHLA